MKRRDFLQTPLGAIPFAVLPKVTVAAEPSLIRGLYGVSSEQPPFDSMSIAERVSFLHQHHVNAVFVKSSEPQEFLQALGDTGIKRFVSQACFTGRTLYRENPEWRPITHEGKEMQPDQWYHGLSPTHPELRKRRLEEMETKIENPHIDGVWLDFIRYPVRWEGASPRMEEACFAPHSLEWFAKFSGFSFPDENTSTIATRILENHAEQWQAFKVEVIRSFVEQVRSLIDERNPETYLGLFMVPWLQDDFDNAIVRIVGQDIETLAPYLDVVSPMLYHRMIARPVHRITEVTESIRQRSGCEVWPITQAMSEPDALTEAEFQEAIRLGAESSGTGVLVFGANHVENESRWNSLADIFGRL